MPFDSEATVEFAVPERLPPPVCETHDIAVPAPQEVAHPQPNSLIRLLPIVTAVATVGVMAAAYYARSTVARNPSLLMFPVVMLMSAVATVLSGSDRRRGEINLRRADYLDDLSTVRAAAVKAIAAQYESILWHHPEPDTLWTLVGGRRMWERRAVDPDFCQVRIGVGTAPLSRQLVAPTIDSVNRVDPVCMDALHRLLDTYSTVSNAPIVIALRGPAVVSVRGGAGQVRALLRAMVCQLAVLHSPATVLIAAVVTDRNRHDWDWLKWLPHNRHPDACDDLGAARMLYASLAAAREALDDVMGSDDPTVPHLVVVVDDESEDPTWAANGVTLLIVEHRDHEPVVVTISGEDVAAVPDQLSYAAALLCAQRLAGYRAGRTDAAPNQKRWQDLVGIDRCNGVFAVRSSRPQASSCSGRHSGHWCAGGAGHQRGCRARYGAARTLHRGNGFGEIGISANGRAGNDCRPLIRRAQPGAGRLQRWCDVLRARVGAACSGCHHQPV